MDDGNGDHPYGIPRTCHSSTNTISSTTATPSQRSAQQASTSRRSVPAMSRSFGSFSNQNPPGGDEDELQPSSSTTPSFATPRQRSRNSGHHLSSSSLGSPDSTYTGHSAMSGSYSYQRGRNVQRTSNLVVQDPCVVSSSTTDDIPPSPFAEESNSQYQVPQQPPPRVTPPSSPSPPPQLIPVESDSNLHVLSSTTAACNSGNSEIERVDSQMNEQEQLSAVPASSSYSLSASSISFSSSSFTNNISPLRNKIKKASSFERFSAQAQASSNNHSIQGSNNQNNSSSFQESTPSSIANTGTPASTVSSLQALRSSSSGWDYGLTSGSNTKSNFVSSLHDSSAGVLSGNKPFHIKKLVARLANVAELERLEAEAALAAAENEQANPRSTNNIPIGCDIVDGVGHSSSVPSQQGPCNNSDLAMSVDSLIRRQLNQTNVTDDGASSTITNNFSESDHNSLPIASRTTPVISTKTFNKKMPLTPKQKLLHRMQSGELTIPLSTTPPPPPVQHLSHQQQQRQEEVIPPQPPSPMSEQQQTQILLNSFQSQQHLMMHDSLQAAGPSVMDDESTSPSNERYTNDMNYEAFIRSTAGEDFSDSMSKGDENNEAGNNQILYDTSDPYNYYYGNILTEDEIFISNNGGNGNLGSVPMCIGSHPSTSRIIHTNIGHNGMEENGMQFQVPSAHNSGHLEFILGLPDGLDRTGREDASQLESGEEIQIQQHQFLDSNELSFSGGKNSQVAEISTLRNLLLEPLSRNQQHDDSWISAAAAEYQNRMNSSNLRLSGNISSVIPGSNSTGSTGVLSGGGNNTWVSEWPLRAWQGQGQQHNEGEQDEVMDMSVIEIEKTYPNSHSMGKRSLQHHLHAHPSLVTQHGLGIEEVDLTDRDLTNGLPLLSSMPLPIELQSSFVNNVSSIGKNQIISDPSALIMTPQHHHQRSVILEYDDEPVNLMNVNSGVNLEQALVHQTTRESENLNMSLSHAENGHAVGDSTNSAYGCVGSNIIFTTTSTTSTTVATAFDTPQVHSVSPQPQSQQVMLEHNTGQETNMDEKRIIRVKKKKENLEALSESADTAEKKPNFILDKPVQPKSFASLPSLLTLTRMSGNGWGVVTNRSKKIPINARFGPVEGPLKRASIVDLENNEAVYPVLVMVDSSGIVYQLDRMDDDLCNWMKFVRRARSGQEQNVLVSEEDGLLYFTSCREIPPKTELQVGYGLEYAEKYNLPYFPVEAKESTKEHLSNTNRKPGGSKKQKRKTVEPEATKKFICFECDMNCASMDELNKHLESIHADGDIDGFRRPKKKAIRKFYKALSYSNQSDQPEGDVKLKEAAEAESVCYTSKRSLKKKEIERLRKEQEEIPVVESSSPDVLPDKSENPQHQDSSSSSGLPPAKVKCNLCYKAFATALRLQKHMIVHSEDYLKPLKCELCAKRFLTNSALAGHSKSHEGKYFECPLCEFCTQQLLLLKEHVQSHKNEETGSFSCPHCPKAFSCYSLVRKHIRAFHGPRLFSCDDCAMKFPTPDKLKLHELRHSSFRAYLCAECGRQFKRKDKLTDHTRKAHGKLKGQMTRILTTEAEPPFTHYVLNGKPKVFAKNKKILPRLSEDQLRTFTFTCQPCMIGFRRRGMLVNHLAKRHPEIDPEHVPELALPITRTAKNYFCPHCERVYKSSSKRKSHILKNHPGKSVPPQVRGKDLKAILEEKVGSTTLDFNLNDFECAEMENIKVSVDEVIRKEAVVGEIVGTPHACTWCHRQYATRAKLLQHQRKFHIELMPPEIQTPRPQKNNVRQLEQSEPQDGSLPGAEEIESREEIVEAQEQEPSPSSMDGSEKQIIIPHQSQENMFGYLITTSGHVTNNEIETLLQPEFVMSLLAQQSSTALPGSSTSTNGSGTRTITLCIPPGIISTTNSHTLSTNPTTELISTGINVNGTQILTKTD